MERMCAPRLTLSLMTFRPVLKYLYFCDICRTAEVSRDYGWIETKQKQDPTVTFRPCLEIEPRVALHPV